MSSDRRAAVKKLRNFYLSPKIDLSVFRSRIDEAFSSFFLPNDVDFKEETFGDIKCDVISPTIFASNRIMLYIHGGSFVGGSRAAYRPFVSALANATASKAYLPELPLAPETRFPKSLEPVARLFNSLYSMMRARGLQGGSDDGEPEIVIMADTSGASIAFALLFGIKEEFRRFVRQVVLFSPWLDFSDDNDMFTSKKVSDEIFTADSVRLAREYYTEQKNYSDPRVSPLKAPRESLSEFPPVFIQMGGKEIFYDDAVIFRSMLRNVGRKCELDVWKSMMPMFQMADEELSESHLAIERVGRLITAKDHSNESVHEIQLELERN